MPPSQQIEKNAIRRLQQNHFQRFRSSRGLDRFVAQTLDHAENAFSLKGGVVDDKDASHAGS